MCVFFFVWATTCGSGLFRARLVRARYHAETDASCSHFSFYAATPPATVAAAAATAVPAASRFGRVACSTILLS